MAHQGGTNNLTHITQEKISVIMTYIKEEYALWWQKKFSNKNILVISVTDKYGVIFSWHKYHCSNKTMLLYNTADIISLIFKIPNMLVIKIKSLPRAIKWKVTPTSRRGVFSQFLRI